MRELRMPAPRATTRTAAIATPRVSRTLAQTMLRRARVRPRTLSRSEPQSACGGGPPAARASRMLSITPESSSMTSIRSIPD
jgi:hypothetical protein